MSVALSSDVLQDDVAVTVARVIASANKRARELNVDVKADKCLPHKNHL
ncbi:hypothetical protein [Iningainema tapete]|uniref:Uncharacterized protein n=1 Tax=Iningainema tapete BLCC-T55 TaxID=2748662 RepID=A0A8J6XRB7_9CYAN|nr:hypothetical protein [Iningainema tapete]MBD2772168.1 hypothetical protein [Iningainema tapete BLCC-T55]